MDIGWNVAPVVVFVGALVVVVGLIAVFFESRYRAESDKKNWLIAVLREQIRMAKEYDETRKVATTAWSNASDLELNALTMLGGPPPLREMFLYLTDHVSIAFEWDPSTEPPQWKEPRRPTLADIRRNAAILVLWDRDYISGVLPAGDDGYSMVASNGAMAIRALYNRLPQSLKTEIPEEQLRF
jgi:hypothetical protein